MGKKDGKENKKTGQTGTQNGNANAASPDREPTANLTLILKELRDFQQDNKSQLAEIKGEITKTNNRLEEAEDRIEKAELQNVEGVLSEMLKLHAQMETKLTEQESRSRRVNIRLYGIPEGAEKDSASVIEFVELLAYKLKKQQAENTISKIRNPESGEIEHRPGKIQQSFEMFYKTLYSQQHIDNAPHIDAFLASLNLPSISEEQNERLASEINN